MVAPYHITTEDESDPRNQPRESDQVDVLIVGAGPSGLAAAIKIKQLANAEGKDLRVCVLEKGAEVGITNKTTLPS